MLEIRNHIIRTALLDGKHVIVDDTNFSPVHLEEVEAIAKSHAKSTGVSVKVEVEFFDTPLEECIARDIKRANGVGEKVICSMYNKYLKPKEEAIQPPEFDPALPNAIIVDIDGTLAKMDGRGPFEWSKVGSDKPHNDIIDLVDTLEREYRVILMSGRDESCREETEKWLEHYVAFPYDMLLMRPAGNMEKDTVVKRRMYEENVKGVYNVAYVIDDRDQVVEMWRSLGLRCLQVAKGDF